MTAALVRTLPAAGRWIVDTETGVYDLDVDTGRAMFLDMAREAAGHVTHPQPFTFDTVEAEVDGVLIFDAATAPRVYDVVLGFTPQYVDEVTR